MKSLYLIKNALTILNEEGKKPTIMLVAKFLSGKVGEATIKKYWRIVNPKTQQKATTRELTYKPKELLLAENIQIRNLISSNVVELYVKEWDLKIYKPKYFQIRFNVNQEYANGLYQQQFNPKFY